MSVLYLLMPVALTIGAGFAIAFVRSSLSGQYEDLITPACRVLVDDEDEEPMKRIENGNEEFGC